MSIRKKGDINPKRDQRIIAAEIERELTDIGEDLRRTALQYLSKHGIDDRGDLSKSIRSEIEQLVNMWRLQFGANAKHGIFVHDGTKPHWAPVKPIKAWARRKLNLKGSELNSATWFIRKKIAEEGTEAKEFLTAAIRVHRPKIAGRIQRSIDKGIKRAS